MPTLSPTRSRLVTKARQVRLDIKPQAGAQPGAVLSERATVRRIPVLSGARNSSERER
jgi:hypothetical protein